MISQMSPPLDVDFSGAPEIHRTERRWIEVEFGRLALSVLADGVDYVIIDLGEETTSIAQVGNSYVTLSSTMKKYGLDTKLKVDTVFHRGSPVVSEMWKASCDRFCQRLLENFDQDRIIIHWALFATALRDSEGTRPVAERVAVRTSKLNLILNDYYAHLQSIIPHAKVIEISEDLRLADPDHRHGVSGLHYIADYDRAFMDGLLPLI